MIIKDTLITATPQQLEKIGIPGGYSNKIGRFNGQYLPDTCRVELKIPNIITRTKQFINIDVPKQYLKPLNPENKFLHLIVVYHSKNYTENSVFSVYENTSKDEITDFVNEKFGDDWWTYDIW